jgi:capsular polysaccharide biosynthesis protein
MPEVETVSASIVVELDANELEVLPLRPLGDILSGYQGSALLVPGNQWNIGNLPDQFHFEVGGDDIPSGLAEVPFNSKPVYLYSVRDAYYFPAYGVVMSRVGHAFRDAIGEAKYSTPDLSALPFMERRGDKTIFTPPSDLPTLENVVVTMPMGGGGNYGHFLLDCLPGVAVTKSLALPDFRYVFPALKPWQEDHLIKQGVDPLIAEDPVYFCNHIVFTSCMNHNLHWPNKHFQMIATGDRESNPTRMTYLSRGRQKRKFISERDLEEVLSQRGFDIVAPEMLSIDQQIDLFKMSKIIVGPTGAGFANILFCSPGSVVVEIQPRGMHNVWVRNLCILLGLRWMPYFCASTIFNLEHPESGMEFDLNIEELVNFIPAR